jgi:hypothetical protein
MNLKHLAYVLLACVVFSACSKKEENPQPSEKTAPLDSSKYGLLSMHMHMEVNGNEAYSYEGVHTLEDGRQVSFSMAQFYLFDIELVKENDALYRIPNKVLLRTMDSASYYLGKVPVGKYKSIRFKVGLPSQLDTSISTSILNKPEMFFGNDVKTNGHVFAFLKGKIDTTSDLSGSANIPFEYKIGTSISLRDVKMGNTKYEVKQTGMEYVHLMFDPSKVFNGISLHDESNLRLVSKEENTSALAQKIADNIGQLFAYEYE